MSGGPAKDGRPRRLGTISVEKVSLAHGGGGRAMRDLIDDVFVRAFDNPLLASLDDQARVPLASLAAHGDRLAVTTDSYVVDPLFFPGGNIGKLAVCGTVNDLAVGGAHPLYLTCGVIIEEGLPVAVLRRATEAMAQAARESGVSIVTGDTKVVPRGACDKLFINTTGVGVVRSGLELGAERARPGDAVIVSGTIGDHGAAIMGSRADLALDSAIKSDCAALHGLVDALLSAAPGVRFMRDATRGGLASVLNEIAGAAQLGIAIAEERVPVLPEVRGLCEILGLDPLYLANEGKLVAVVPADQVAQAIAAMTNDPFGQAAACIGYITTDRPGRVVMRSVFGGNRIVDMLSGEQLPRIC